MGDEPCFLCTSGPAIPQMAYCSKCRERVEVLEKCRECGNEMANHVLNKATCPSNHCRVDTFFSCPDHPCCPACGDDPADYEMVPIQCDGCDGRGHVQVEVGNPVSPHKDSLGNYPETCGRCHGQCVIYLPRYEVE